MASVRPRAAWTVCAAVLLLAGPTGPSSPVDAQGPARSHWWDEIDRVAERMDAGKWRKAARELDALRTEVVRTSWRSPDLGELLAELAFRAAIIEAHRGRHEDAVWEWHVALNHDRTHGSGELAGRDLGSYGRSGELLAAHPLRGAGEPPPGVEPARPRPDRRYRPPERPGFELHPLGNVNATRVRPAPVAFEVLIDADGRVRQPVVTTAWSHPIVIQWGLDNLRRMPPFKPARLDGETVPVLETLELELTGDPRRW